MIALLEIGKHEYPNKVTFTEALRIAKIAIDKYDGKMSNKDVAETLGYKIKNPNAISGTIFRKFDDLCAYNLMKRERGFIRTTEIAGNALNPYDSRVAEIGKAEAIRKMGIVNKAFTQWNGEIPSETAFSAKTTNLLNVSWQEAQKHAKSLRKLFIELFPYLKAVSESTSIQTTEAGRDTLMKDTTTVALDVHKPQVIGELRTEDYGVIKIKDETSIAMAKMALNSLEQKLKAEKEEKAD